MISFAGLTDIGLARQNNEDVWVALPELGFFAIADGMGGHQAGEVAAKEAIEQLCLYIQSQNGTPSPDNPVRRLRLAIEKANEWVYEKGQESLTLNGMGTTLCCLYWIENVVIYAHIGDSRIYRFRNGILEQLTQDHSLLTKWLAECKALQAELPYPQKNVITRAIGTSKRVTPEIAVAPVQPGDLFILCSDGLSDTLSLEEMEQIISQPAPLQTAAARLIERAKIKGGNDNITVLLTGHHFV